MLQQTSDYGAVIKGVSVELREFFDQTLLSYKEPWSPVIRTVNSEGKQETYSGTTGGGTLTRNTEGANITQGQRYKLYDTTIVNDEYSKHFEITRQALKYRGFQEVLDENKHLINMAMVTRSKAGAQIFNRAFTSGDGLMGGIKVFTYNDGKALASTAHPRVDGGTAQSNASASGITLTENNFETGRIALQLQLQDDGNPITIVGDIWLVVPQNLEKTAMIITMSDQRSGTSNNDLNIYKGGPYNVMTSKWLDSGMSGSGVGSNTAWFLVAPSTANGQSPLIFQEAGTIELQPTQVDKGTLSVFFTVINDFAVGSVDWRGFWASKGDQAAYSG